MSVPAGLVAAGLAAGAVWFLLPVSAERRCRTLCARSVSRPPAVTAHRRWRAERRRQTNRAGPSDVVPARVCALLDLVAAALDAGLAPSRALDSVLSVLPSPEQQRLRRAAAMLDIGGDPEAVWQLLAQDPVLGPLAQALERSERSGAPVAASVRALADELRRDDRARRLGAARRVGIRTTVPLAACFLPAFFLIAIVPTVIALLDQAF